MPPKLTIAQENDELECKFALVVTLDTPLYVDSKDEKDTHRIITSFARVGNSDPTLAVMGITGSKKVVEPYRREFVKSPDGVFVKKIKYYYEQSYETFNAGLLGTWESRAQITSRGLRLPTEYKPGLLNESASGHGEKIPSSDDIAWVNAKLKVGI